MKIKRAISLILSVLIVMTTVVSEPLSLISVRAAEIDEVNETIIDVDSTESQETPEEEIDSAVLEDEEVEEADVDSSEQIDVDDEDDEGGEAEDTEDTDDENLVKKEALEAAEIELPERDSKLAKAAGDVAINEANFPDLYFRSEVYYSFDRNQDMVLSKAEITAAKMIDANNWYIASLQGIEYFTNLEILSCYGNYIRSVNLRANTKLRTLLIGDNLLTDLDISKNTELRTLSVNHNQLSTLNISQNAKLTSLTCNNNRLENLNLSNQAQLTHLECQSNNLTVLNINNNTKLRYLNCSNNGISGTLNTNSNTHLNYIVCSNNKLTSINVTNNINLGYLECDNNQLTSLNTAINIPAGKRGSPNDSYNWTWDYPTMDPADARYPEFTAKKKYYGLRGLSCKNNKIETLDVNTNKCLVSLNCSNNALSTLVINNDLKLEYLEFEGQKSIMSGGSVSTKANSDRTITATWSAVAGATGYELYRRDNTYSNWEIMANKEISGTSYKDTKVRLGETYLYKLYAFKKDATKKTYLTYSSSSNTSKTTIPIPQNIKTSVADASTMNISWGKVNQADGYIVYVATSKNGKYTSINSVPTGLKAASKSTSLKHTGAKVGTTYYYKVRAYVNLGGKIVYSGYSSIVSRKQIVPKVMGIKTEQRSANSIRVRWNKVNNATGYEIYQARSKGGTYKKVATIKKSGTVAYAAKNLSPNKRYYFKVRAYRTVSGAKKNGKFSAVTSRKAALAKPVLTAKVKNKTSINLSWKKVAGAKQYEIYRSTSKNGKYKKIATVKARKFTSTKLKKNKEYFYKIKAVEKIGNKTYRSAFSATKSARTKK